ncbi:MAG: hypothetical protein KJN60_13010 [Boseongicola sp.]|nr:hypothetical protein [Boseongicola sp.]
MDKDDTMHMCDCSFCVWCGEDPGTEPELRALVVAAAVKMVDAYLLDGTLKIKPVIDAVRNFAGVRG